MVIGGKRRFSGKSFKLWNKYPNKRDANKAKAHLKGKGYKVRVIPHIPYGTSSKQYVVYYRKY